MKEASVKTKKTKTNEYQANLERIGEVVDQEPLNSRGWGKNEVKTPRLGTLTDNG